MSGSEINHVLSNSLSRDANLRNAAEQQLLQAAANNFPLYLVTLVEELATEESDGAIRAAAGLALKNAFTSRDFTRQQELKLKWVTEVDEASRTKIKDIAMRTLGSPHPLASVISAQVISAVGAIELPLNMWPHMMLQLVRNVSEGTDHEKQSSLYAIGYICDTIDQELRTALTSHSNAILTAVIQGGRKEEPNMDIRLAAIQALAGALEFVENNFRHEGERNYIMQVVCESTQADDSRIKQASYGCLSRIMTLYYENMRFYMEKALFGLTILGMKSPDEDVAKLAVEFWSSVCEEEIRIEEDNALCEPHEQPLPYYNFARIASTEVVPTLLSLLTRQDPDAGDDDYNASKAAYQCLQLYSQATKGHIILMVLQFVEENIHSEHWHCRDAAVSAFGAAVEGPEQSVLDPIVQQGLPVLVKMAATDVSLHVRDSAAYAIGRVLESCAYINPAEHLAGLVQALFTGLMAPNSKMALSSCWALINVADRFSADGARAKRSDSSAPADGSSAGQAGSDPASAVNEKMENDLTPYFNQSITNLLTVVKEPECETTTRTAAYEVLAAFVRTSAPDSLLVVGDLAQILNLTLEDALPLYTQIVSVEDRIMLEDMITSICAVLHTTIYKLDSQIGPQADRIMAALLATLQTFSGKSAVPEAVFAVISTTATATEAGFAKYLAAFNPFLLNALANQEEPSLCSMAIGLVGDITRAVGAEAQPYCDNFMNYLLNNLRSPTLSNQFKPAILQCFGDIATAIGGPFETYLSVVAQVLQQAAAFEPPTEAPIELYDYAISLREGVMDCWSGIITAMKTSNKTQVLQPYIRQIFAVLNTIAVDLNRSEPLLRCCMGVIGDLCETFPNGELHETLRQNWVLALIKETKGTRSFGPRTKELARWARDCVRRQLSLINLPARLP